MSKNVFYADLDNINNRGVLVTGHGKGIVNKNGIVNGGYIANDMVKLTVENGKLYGYQGYVDMPTNKLTHIEYMLYLYAKDEQGQPVQLQEIDVNTYLQLSRHNIECGQHILARNDGDTYAEYRHFLLNTTEVRCFAVPYTDNEIERAVQINEAVK